MFTITKTHQLIVTTVKLLALSWMYAFCSQIIIPLPFNPIPVSLQPLPLLLCAFFFGRQAVTAYGLYLVQGALGLPFFSHFGSGLAHLCGPTGGYLLGWGFGMALIASCLDYVHSSYLRLALLLCTVGLIYFGCGLLQISLLIPADKVLAYGFYPFIIGDGIKLIIVWIIAHQYTR